MIVFAFVFFSFLSVLFFIFPVQFATQACSHGTAVLGTKNVKSYYSSSHIFAQSCVVVKIVFFRFVQAEQSDIWR